MAYSDKVVDHYEHPRNVGTLDKSSSEVGTGLVGAPECGDVMRLQIKVNPETQVIEDAKFKTFGCGSAIASSSLATEWVKGKTVAEALTISNTDIVKELALPPVKIHCSVLAEDAIRAAIGDWKKKNNVAENRRRSRSRSLSCEARYGAAHSAVHSERMFLGSVSFAEATARSSRSRPLRIMGRDASGLRQLDPLAMAHTETDICPWSPSEPKPPKAP